MAAVSTLATFEIYMFLKFLVLMSDAAHIFGKLITVDGFKKKLNPSLCLEGAIVAWCEAVESH